MNQEFIEKTKANEEAFLNNELKIESKEDLERWKQTLLDLWDLCEDTNLPGKTKTCVNYLKCIYQSIKKIEKNYRGNIKEENLEKMVYQLKVLWNFSRQSYLRSELEENYKLEKEAPYIDVRDIMDKDYRIKESDCALFDASCKIQKELFNEYLQVYTCIYKSQEEKINLLNEYLNDAHKLKKEFLGRKITITDLKQWDIFGLKLKEFIKNTTALHNDLEDIHHFKIKKNGDEKFIDFVFTCMQKIEGKYAENKTEMDLTYIMDRIFVMCKYQSLAEKKDALIFSSLTHKNNKEETEEVYTSTHKVVSIDKSKSEIWKKLDHEQKTIEEEYQKAYQFLFGENLEPENSEKRGL